LAKQLVASRVVRISIELAFSKDLSAVVILFRSHAFWIGYIDIATYLVFRSFVQATNHCRLIEDFSKQDQSRDSLLKERRPDYRFQLPITAMKPALHFSGFFER
jgi:uncharacterized membrane protein